MRGRRGIGRDEQFQREVAEHARIGAGGVLLESGPPASPPPRTVTEVNFQGCAVGLVRVTNDADELVGYQLRIMDPFFNTIYIMPMEPDQAEAFHLDFAEMLAGPQEEDSEPDVHPEHLKVVDGQ